MKITIIKFKWVIITILTHLLVQSLRGQENKAVYSEFLEYKKWGYTVNPVLYTSPKYDRTSGNVSISGNVIPSVNFGFEKVIHPERKFTFRYGVHLNLLPHFSVDYSLPDNDIPGITENELKAKGYGQLAFSVPLEVELKKQMGSRLYFSARAGFNILFLREGSVDVGSSTFIEDQNEVREFFGLRSRTRKFPLYPNLKISPGFYYMTKSVLYQVSIIYQKAIPNYFKGEFLFDNLDISERTEGNYTLSGDQLGLGITVFLRKSKKRLKKIKEKALKNVYL